MTVELTYIGARGSVEIETAPTVFTVVKAGETVTVPDALAKGDPKAGTGGLLDQPDNWVEAKKPAPKKTD
jgi:hypothetical protein